MEQSQKLTVWNRLKMPTPLFFRRVRAIGAALGALGMVLTTTQVPLPAIIITLGSYLILAGSVAAAISSVAVEPEPSTPTPTHKPIPQKPLPGPATAE